MKLQYFALFAFVLLASSVQAQSLFDQWEALDEYHNVMAATFHPMEDGNLEPIKERSEELAQASSELANSAVPAQFEKKGIQKILAKLERSSHQLNELIESGKATDEEITEALTETHEVFHELVGMCRD